MKRFLIADTHFGHSNIIEYEKRPFHNAAKMDYELIKLWNSVVSKNDIVYVLGDFTLSRDKSFIKSVAEQLNGKKILIMGNHDSRKPKDYIECGFDAAIQKPIMVEPGVILMHEPFLDNIFIGPNYIYFYGHVHSKQSIMENYPNCMCVSVERINYKPINLDECINKIQNIINKA